MRIEDTDRERSKPEFEEDIRNGLAWLGIAWDEEPLRQTERIGIYERYLAQLIAERKAYWCFCSEEELETAYQAQLSQGLSPKYRGTCRTLSEDKVRSRIAAGRPAVIRFKMPDRVFGFTDLIRGKVEFNAGLIGDFIIAKGLREPLYNFAVVIDDAESKITHVIRGEEHLSNTPKQQAISEALGFESPHFAHLPLILGPDRKKLSKRFMTGSLRDYRRDGYLPQALLNFLVLLGWHPEVDREVISVPDMVKEFTLKRVQKAGAIFNPEKLDWLNATYLRQLPLGDLLEHLKPFVPPQFATNEALIAKAAGLVRDRMKRLSDFPQLAGMLFELPEYPLALLAWKQAAFPAVRANLEAALAIIDGVPLEAFSRGSVEPALLKLAEERGRGDVLWPLRVSLSGQEASPGPLELIDTLGKEESVRRIRIAIDKIGHATLV